ncbi:single-stranded DNA-binding protein [Helicobacter anseris]|uniref:Single-stranded DNA-binding protein n=1 Tax=Helicobacter anseris TaxID=375926 RepID=A0A3D8J6Y3_9HELI|nr:single-stranded DNA-binding protein [Helicobacter anseris]RDU73040.1 single-stranded DNA-binding protein [Helicobacter anseris]
MFNKVILLGNLTKDVELKHLPSGMATCIISVATNRKTKKQDGSIHEETCFIDCKLFGRYAEIAKQYLMKGSRLHLEGRLTYETWTDQQGVKKSKHIIVCESLRLIDKIAQNSTQQTPQNNQGVMQGQMPPIDINEDEIPF